MERRALPDPLCRDLMADGADAVPLWPQMNAAERTTAYSPSSMVEGNLGPYIQAYADLSAAAYGALDVQTLRYGERSAQTIDVAVPASETPTALHVFIHGGYWQQLSKTDSFFAAPETLAQGIAFAAVDYTLAPHATIDEIVAEVVAALRHLRGHAAALNIDPARIVVSGSSAGAQLAAMAALLMDAAEQPAGVVLLSGVYDLRPLRDIYVNDALGMDDDEALRNSPVLRDVSGFPPAVIAWGENETDEFKRQSRQFAQTLMRAERQVEMFEVAGRNHFDIVHDLANGSRLGRAVARLAGV